jgi:hypothetical protein
MTVSQDARKCDEQQCSIVHSQVGCSERIIAARVSASVNHDLTPRSPDGDRTALISLVNNGRHMSKRNGDRARFQKDRKRKMLRRQRIQALVKTLRPPSADLTPRT